MQAVTEDTLQRLDREFEAEHRPWVNFEVNLGSPLTFDDEGWHGGTRWHIALDYELKHSGRTPATNVEFSASIVPFIIPTLPPGISSERAADVTPLPGTDVEAEIAKSCFTVEALGKAGMKWGEILFPDDRHVGRLVVNGNRYAFEVAEGAPGYTGQFLIITAVTYGATFGDRHYRTVRVWQLWKRSGDEFIALSGEGIATPELGFERYPPHGAVSA